MNNYTVYMNLVPNGSMVPVLWDAPLGKALRAIEYNKKHYPASCQKLVNCATNKEYCIFPGHEVVAMASWGKALPLP